MSITLAPTWGGGRSEIGPGAPDAWRPIQSEGGAGRMGAEVADGLALGGGRGTLIPYGGVDWTDEEGRVMRVGTRWCWDERLSARLEGEFEEHGSGRRVNALFAEVRVAW